MNSGTTTNYWKIRIFGFLSIEGQSVAKDSRLKGMIIIRVWLRGLVEGSCSIHPNLCQELFPNSKWPLCKTQFHGE